MSILFVGPFPGPITGQTVMTLFLYEYLSENSQKLIIKKLNIARGNGYGPLINAIIKILRAGFASIFILFVPRSYKTCYISLDANIGMILTCLYVFLARLRARNCVIHHHSNSHITNPNLLMSIIAYLAGEKAAHIVICKRMGQNLQKVYPNVKRVFSFSNIAQVELPSTQHLLPRETVYLGHMSKLSKAKGIEECVNVFESLLKLGLDVKLIFAGPPATQKVAVYLQNIQEKHLGRLVHKGLISGTEKATFFASIDFFLFPSVYKNETQGIVNLEALAAGTPPLANGLCCINDDLKDLEWLISPQENYVKAAQRYIFEHTIKQDNRLELQKSAQDRFNLLKAESRQQLNAVGELFLENV